MGFTIKGNKKLLKILNPKGDQSLIPKVRKQFSIRSPKIIKRTIIQDVIRGVSPVKGKGKWKRYSKSYVDVIKNRAAYRVYNGKVVRISRIGGSSGVKKRNKAKVEELNRKFHSKSNPKKQISPVNLRHSGGLHNSFVVFTKGGFLRNFRMVFHFKSKLADYHDRLGAGKSRVIRRLLPTRTGERFNKRIHDQLFKELKKAAETIAKQFNRQ